MILPTLKEEQILNELLTDYAEVKRDIRKTVKKRQRAAQKRGHTIRNGSVEVLTTRTKNGNNWVCCVYYERDRTASWNLSACCEAEGEKGRKDYYLLRGLSDQPYFIRLTSHAVRRYKERQLTDMWMMCSSRPSVISILWRMFQTSHISSSPLVVFSSLTSLHWVITLSAPSLPIRWSEKSLTSLPATKKEYMVPNRPS